MTVDFSLLLPVYSGDSPEFFRRAFRSAVQEQELPPSEVVLVQDGPVGGALMLAIKDSISESTVPVQLVVMEKNVGLATALAHGLEMCKHEVVARMDADDISVHDRFSRQLPLIESGVELVGAGMHEFILDPELGEVVVGQRTPPIDPTEISTYARFHDPFNHPTVVYTKSAVSRAGGYQPLGLMEDYWLFARMIAAGVQVANLPDPLVRYRVSSGAYQRRGGWALLKSEWFLQREFRKSGFTTFAQYLRNLAVRGGYRLVPEGIRRLAYRRLIARRFATSPTNSTQQGKQSQ